MSVRWNGRIEGGATGVRAFLRFVQITGRWVGPFLLRIGTWFALPLLPVRRRGAEEFFTHLRGHRAWLPVRWLDTYRCFLTFTLCWFERLYVFLHGPQAVTAEVEGNHHIDQALAAGHGVVLITAHFGNFELGAWLLGHFLRDQTQTPPKINVVMIEQEIEEVRAFMAQVSGDARPNIIAVNRSRLASLDLLGALRRNEIVCIQGDRAVASSSRPVPFLGRPAPFPIGPYQLAEVAGAAVIPTFSVRTGPFRYRFTLHAPLDLRGAGLNAPERQYVRLLERQVLRHPEQWFNVFSFWDASHAPAHAEPLPSP